MGEAEIRRRLLVFLEGYDLSDEQRTLFPAVLDQRRSVGERFVLSRVEAGEKAFGRWATPEGQARLEAERQWIAALPADVAQ